MNQIASSFFWKFIERSGNQVAGFIVTLVLARILNPSDYGLVALIMVFTSISSTFVQGGFNTALIQTKHVSKSDYSSVMWFSLGIAAILYLILFLTAPIVAEFYHLKKITIIMRTLAFILFPSALNSVQVAHVTRDLQFKPLSIANLISMFVSSFIGIGLAYHGAGAWALVIQQLLAQTTVCISLFFLTRWFPNGTFSWESIRRLIPFGSKVLASDFMVSIFLNVRTLIIGRMYSAASLGFFNRGKSVPQTIMESIDGTVQSVLLPIYSKKQDEKSNVVSMIGSTIRMISFITFPMSFGMACIATPLISVLLTSKWLACVPYLQIFAIGYIFNPPQTAASTAYNALGKSSYSLTIEVIRKITELILLLISMQFGVMAIALSTIANGIIGTVATMIMNAKKLNYSMSRQLSDVLPAILLSFCMSAVILVVGLFINNVFMRLFVEILVGVFVYISLAALCKVRAYNTLKLVICASLLK